MTVDTKIIPVKPENAHATGRHIEHDERSHSYPMGALPWRALKDTAWHRHVPILDQEDLHAQGIPTPDNADALGSCTGNAGTGFLGTDPWFATVGSEVGGQLHDPVTAERFAIGLYEQATVLDDIPGSYPGQDTGSSGLAIAKALVARGLMRTYLHAFGLTPMLSALQSQPVLVGINWYESMFDPKADGTLEIAGDVAGGHEIVCDGVWIKERMLRFPNSWGPGWGDKGYFFLSFDQMDRLLGEGGDVTVPYR